MSDDRHIIRAYFRASLFNARIRVYVCYDDGGMKEFLLAYYPDEIQFTEADFTGKTRAEALQLQAERDQACLQARATDFRNLIAVVCTRAPQGRNGLEGFLLGDEYRVKQHADDSFTVYLRDGAGQWQPQGRASHRIVLRYFNKKEWVQAAGL